MGGFLWARRAEMKTMSDCYRLLPATGKVKRHATRPFFLSHALTVENPGTTKPASTTRQPSCSFCLSNFTLFLRVPTFHLVFMVFFCRALDLLGRIFLFIQRYLLLRGLHQIHA